MTAPAPGYFITGTDTGVGKTLVSQALLRQLCGQYPRVAAFKPVASGCDITPAGLRNADALALQQAASIALPYATVNPYAFAPAIAPHLAAAQAGVHIDIGHIVAIIAAVQADMRVVEGAGGWLVPLNDTETLADLAQQLELPVILVVGMRLGCLNHALLSVAAMRASGVSIAGWVANHIDPAFDCAVDNLRTLEQRLDVPLLASIPWLDDHGSLPDIRFRL